MKLTQREKDDLADGKFVLLGYAYYSEGTKRVRFSITFSRYSDAIVVAERFDKGANYWEIKNSKGVVNNA